MKNKLRNNIIDKKTTRKIIQETLRQIKEYLINSAGPYASTTGIIDSNCNTIYTKDGHTILSAITYTRPIENSIKEVLESATRHVVKEVGDGTTSSVILSSLIFDELLKLEENDEKIVPHKLLETFKRVAKDLKDIIDSNKRELTLDDVRTIAMVCTNSNTEVSDIIYNIYKESGLGVFIDVSSSFSGNHQIKSYDGLTLDAGYFNSCFINTEQGNTQYCIIDNPRLYSFIDPVDDEFMYQFFMNIIDNNIRSRYNGPMTRKEDYIPTVIVAPTIGGDLSSYITEIVSFMHSFEMEERPPLLIVSSLDQLDKEVYSDCIIFSGNKSIRKYIDMELRKVDIEKGLAPDLNTICEFYGEVKQVKASSNQTAFIEPKDIYERNESGSIILDSEDKPVLSKSYKANLNFLEAEYKKEKENANDASKLYVLQKRLNSLKSSVVELLIGGIAIADRDSARALAEDAVKNIRSAVANGIGYGCNYEGLRACYILLESFNKDDHYYNNVLSCFLESYNNIFKILVESSGYTMDNDKIYEMIKNNNGPMNLNNGLFDKTILSSIESDKIVIDCLEKIIAIVFTTNQTILENPTYNVYEVED